MPWRWRAANCSAAPDAVSAALRPVEEAAVEDRKETDVAARGRRGGRGCSARRRPSARRSERQRRDGRSRPRARIAANARQTLAATAAGYAMTLQRVERAMAQHGLEPIPAVGQPFDPDRMEVLEVVLDSGRPSGEVVEEVRRGYLWQGRVFRYAQVRVAKNQCRSGERRGPAVGRTAGINPAARLGLETVSNGRQCEDTVMDTIVGIDLGTTNSEVALVQRRPAARLRGGRRSDLAVVRRPGGGRPAAGRQGGQATSGCWRRNAPSSRSSARWART